MVQLYHQKSFSQYYGFRVGQNIKILFHLCLLIEVRIMTEAEKTENLRLSNEESNRFTCECLKTALIHLVAQKSFNDISVSELVKEAGVSRNSFYRNYGTMDALLNTVKEEAVSVVSELLKSRDNYENKADWYLDIFRIVKEQQREFHILLGIKVPLNFFADNIDYGKLLPVSLAEPTYEDLSTAGAFLIILFHWFNTGMKESPEEMAAICCRILSD